MTRGRPKAELVLAEDERVQLTSFARSRSLPASLSARARIVLSSAEGVANGASRSSYGRPRILRSLHKQGLQVGHERLRKSLLRQCLRPVYKRPYRVTTDSNHRKPVAGNVLDRRFDGWQVNRAWVGDITYVATDEGWLYLAAVMDLGSRRIVGWSMSERMKAELVCDALKLAYWLRRRPHQAGPVGGAAGGLNHEYMAQPEGLRRPLRGAGRMKVRTAKRSQTTPV